MAIVGCPFLSGFFSKDEIIWYAYAAPHGHWLLWILAAASAVLTMFYMMRLWFVAFTGDYRGSVDSVQPGSPHLHPPSGWMKFALIVLAAGSVLAGYVGLPHMFSHWAGALGLSNLLGHNRFEEFLQPVFGTPSLRAVHEALGPTTGFNNWYSMLITLNLLVIGLAVAWAIYFRRPEGDERFQKSLPGLWRLLQDKYRVDEAYNLILVKPLLATGKFLDQGIDLALTAVADFLSHCPYRFGKGVRWIQDGHMQTYALAMTLGLLAFVLLMVISY
jgi:NADH-quinone oxidoreductase subunit L